MKLIGGESYDEDLDSIAFEQVEELQYSGVLLSIKNNYCEDSKGGESLFCFVHIP